MMMGHVQREMRVVPAPRLRVPEDAPQERQDAPQHAEDAAPEGESAPAPAGPV